MTLNTDLYCLLRREGWTQPGEQEDLGSCPNHNLSLLASTVIEAWLSKSPVLGMPGGKEKDGEEKV
jgi:hypothetical protein